MLNEIENLTAELQSKKVQERQKAFNKFNDILNGRLLKLQNLIDGSEEVSWATLFKATHKGMALHSQKLHEENTELNENDLKIKTYSQVILKLCDSPADGEKQF